jgi:uncharacterized DUF497 family protein
VNIEWDEAKNVWNQSKHELSFEDAASLFSSGVEYLEIFDEAHSITEDRFIALGPIDRGVVMVVWTERDENVIRIISARFASTNEVKLYHNYLENRQ